MTTSVEEHPSPEVGIAVSEWIEQVDDLLCRLQIVMQVLQVQTDVPPEAKRTTGELLTVLRELRSDTPRPAAVTTWLRALACDAGVRWLRGPARFINAAGSLPPKTPTGA